MTAASSPTLDTTPVAPPLEDAFLALAAVVPTEYCEYTLAHIADIWGEGVTPK